MIRARALAPVSWRLDALASGCVGRGHLLLLLRAILLFGPPRSHSSVPPRRRAQPARGAAVKDDLWSPAGLVLDGREHAGRLCGTGISRKPLLVIDRREIPDRGMAASGITKRFDESKHRHACFGLRFEPLPIEQLHSSVAKKLSHMALS
jgi:hypothetical protein